MNEQQRVVKGEKAPKLLQRWVASIGAYYDWFGEDDRVRDAATRLLKCCLFGRAREDQRVLLSEWQGAVTVVTVHALVGRRDDSLSECMEQAGERLGIEWTWANRESVLAEAVRGTDDTILARGASLHRLRQIRGRWLFADLCWMGAELLHGDAGASSRPQFDTEVRKVAERFAPLSPKKCRDLAKHVMGEGNAAVRRLICGAAWVYDRSVTWRGHDQATILNAVRNTLRTISEAGEPQRAERNFVVTLPNVWPRDRLAEPIGQLGASWGIRFRAWVGPRGAAPRGAEARPRALRL